jgi:hypothetical protein
LFDFNKFGLVGISVVLELGHFVSIYDVYLERFDAFASGGVVSSIHPLPLHHFACDITAVGVEKGVVVSFKFTICPLALELSPSLEQFEPAAMFICPRSEGS